MQKKKKRKKKITTKLPKKQKQSLRIAGLIAAAALLLFLSLWMLQETTRYHALSGRVAALHQQIEDLTAYNDAKEYQIHANLDLEQIIQGATGLGMVRSSSGQVRTYHATNQEYILKKQDLPTK